MIRNMAMAVVAGFAVLRRRGKGAAALKRARWQCMEGGECREISAQFDDN